MAADPSDMRRSAFLLLTAVAVAIAAAKTVGGENVYEPSRYKPAAEGGYGYEPDRKWPETRPDPVPMFSSNDKSRWATVRALVHDKTYVIGKRTVPHDPKSDTGIVAEPAYKSTDVVLNPETQEFYSSKPPLMATIVAGEYWVLNKAFGWDIVRDRWLVIPAIVLTWNVLPFAIYLVLLGRLIDLIGKTDYGKLLAFTAAAVGTFLTTFAGTLNNHTPAAFCVLFATYPLLKAVIENRDMTPAGYLACGFFASFAATFELPALAFVAAVGLPLLVARTRNTLLFFLPAALVPIFALYLCNYIALGTIEPVYDKFGGPWYRFEGSHWSKIGTPAAKGLDFNNEPTTVYAFHLSLGHHGWFSLSPVWLVALAGLLALGIQSARHPEVAQRKGNRLDAGDVRRDDAGGVRCRVRLLPDADAELQLWGQHKRPAVAVLAHPAVGVGGTARRRPARALRGRPAARRLPLGSECAECVLPGVEPVA